MKSVIASGEENQRHDKAALASRQENRLVRSYVILHVIPSRSPLISF